MKKIILLAAIVASSIVSRANSCANSAIRDTSIKAAAKKFFYWYYSVHSNQNDTTFRIPVISGGGELENGMCDTSKPFRINFYEANRYINQLQQTGLFSLKFLKALDEYYSRCDSNFAKHKQYCGEPMGFDEVPIFRYMDDIGIQENMNNFKVVQYARKKNTAFVKLKFTRVDFFTFQFTLIKNKWLIDKVNGDFPKKIDFRYNYNECCGGFIGLK